jgi:hypothetical protein
MVIGPQRDILDVAENFLEFFVEESCGQCTPCRLGTTPWPTPARPTPSAARRAQFQPDLDLDAELSSARRVTGRKDPART